jgi:hypothetical protein
MLIRHCKGQDLAELSQEVKRTKLETINEKLKNTILSLQDAEYQVAKQANNLKTAH